MIYVWLCYTLLLKFTGHRWIPLTKGPEILSYNVFFRCCTHNTLLNEQSSFKRFGGQLCLCDVIDECNILVDEIRDDLTHVIKLKILQQFCDNNNKQYGNMNGNMKRGYEKQQEDISSIMNNYIVHHRNMLFKFAFAFYIRAVVFQRVD